MNLPGFKESIRSMVKAVAFVCLLTSANAAVFMKVGDIKGEAQDIRYEGQSEVLSWSWGMSNAVSVAPGGGTGGRVNMGAFTFSKHLDKATPRLMEACANGTHQDRAVLTIATGGRASIELYRFVLEGVSVVRVQATAAGDRPIETVSLNFARVGVEYVRITPSGTAGEKGRFAWDIAANREGGVTFPGDTVTDADNDRLPDDWERLYGLDPTRANADGDSDADGATDYDEFVAGTAPNSRDSVFKATFGAPAGAAAGALTWSSVAGKQYRVLVSDRLGDTFQVFGTYTSTDNRSTSVSLPFNVGTKFFRIEVVPAAQ